MVLQITVDEQVSPGTFNLSLVLKDESGHSWKFAVEANLEESIIPYAYNLMQNYPNPFNSKTKIKYSLANQEEQRTVLDIFDILGQHIQTVVDERKRQGNYTATWDGLDNSGSPAPSGVYLYQLSSGSFVESKKMILLR